MERDVGDFGLHGKRILIVEDRYLLADDLTRDLAERGATVVGPAPTVEHGRALAEANDIDVALLDIDLRGQTVYGLAEELSDRGIPVIFASGMPQSSLPGRWAADQFVSKPISKRRLVLAIETALGANGHHDRSEDRTG